MTSVALMLAPLTCGVVMLISGIAKAGNLASTRDAFASMGVPRALRSGALATSLPYVEIGLGVLLLATWSWPLAVVAAATMALFAAYWVLVLRVLRRDEKVDCGCFGALGDDRVTATTLARNSLLVLLGALATAFGAAGSGVVPALRDFGRTDWWWLVLSAAVATTAVLVVGLRGPDEPALDDDLLDYERDPIPFAILEDEAGSQTTLRRLASQRAQLLVLLSSTCTACQDVADQLPDWNTRLGPVDISAVFTERLDGLRSELRPDGIPLWFDVERGATDIFATNGRPVAVLLGADGALAGGPVVGQARLASFIEDVEAELAFATDAPEGPRSPEREPAAIRGHDHGHDDDHGHV